MRPNIALVASVIAVAGFTLVGCAVSAPPDLESGSADASAVSGTLVVDLIDGTSLDEAREATGLDLAWAHPLSADESLAVVDVPNLSATAARLENNPLVEVVEPVIEVEAFGYPDDPMYARQWNLKRVNATAGWRAGGGAGVIVAVIDTGVSAVPDLAETDVLSGISVVPGEPGAQDSHGHGTHVAGTVAQATNNGIGVAGVAPHATILPIKALSARGSGQSQWIATAIDEAADQGADIINMSLGGGYSGVIANAVEKAQARGVLIIAAAGNSGREGVGYPAALPGVIGVSAVGPDDGLAFYSSWGEGVDISAPGGDTRIPDGGILQDTVAPGGHAYKEFQGTSMASPHVAGAAAVLWRSAGGDAEVVANVLQSSATDLGAPGFDAEYGHGRLDVRRAIRSLAVRHQGLLFAIGGIAAFLLAGLGGVGPRRPRRAIITALAGGLTAGGAFFLPLLPLPPSQLLAMFSKPLLLWPSVLLPDALASNPLVLSALIPVGLTLLLGPTRLLGPIVAGVCAGVATHMLYGAMMGGLVVWPLAGATSTVWLVLNGAIALMCAVAVVGVGRMNDRKDAEI
jgi:serine protease